MRLVDFMSEKLVIPGLSGTTRDEALQEIVACIVAAREHIDPKQALSVLTERERLGSTGVGQGLAIPHARLSDLDETVACFARSAAGVAFAARDGQPTHLLFTILAPRGKASSHLNALARASRLFRDAAFRRDLLAADGPAEIYRLIDQQDRRLGPDGS